VVSCALNANALSEGLPSLLNVISITRPEVPFGQTLTVFEGEKSGAVMEKSDGKPVPVCLLAHELMNRLFRIIGNCDLISPELPADSESAKRLLVIRENARSMAAEVNRHQCELQGLLRTKMIEKSRFF